MMIGPSSGTGGGVPNRDSTESPGIRGKRKVFDELDIDNFCDDSCQSGKKRYLHLTELTSTGMQADSSSSLSVDQKPSSITYTHNAGYSEEISSSGSMARLEVLVVDGNWDEETSGIGSSASLTNLTNHHGNVVNSVLADIQSLDNYGTIPNYWETINPGVHHNAPEVFMPHNHVQQPHEDQENGNLSWLLDFKLDSLIEATEDKCPNFGTRDNRNGTTNVSISNRYSGSSSIRTSNVTSSGFVQEMKRPYAQGVSSSAPVNQGTLQNDNVNSSTVTNHNAVNDNRNNSVINGRYGGPKKPPFTYTELIEHALQERGELTVSAIYQWISEHFPYYKSNDDRWKNSVRHNLSINPHFRKGSKAPHGAGHLWAIANRGDTRPRQSVPNGNGTLTRQLVAKNGQDNSYRKNGSNLRSQSMNQIVTLDEIAAATASIQRPEDNNEIINSVTLEHCAEQILSGIKREVEVQYLVPMVGNNPDQQSQQNNQSEQHRHIKETDFLNPVSKEVVAEECGLIGEGYLVTDLNPTTLGLNMVEPENISPDHLFGEELSFQFYELTSPSQLQSA